jgi:hypothetical protein
VKGFLAGICKNNMQTWITQALLFQGRLTPEHRNACTPTQQSSAFFQLPKIITDTACAASLPATAGLP